METDNRTRGSESGHDNLLRSCTALLTRRDFTACRDSANRIPRSDPEISTKLDRILAIADVLSSASRRLGPNKTLPDHYSVLNLRPSDAANRDLARREFKTLVRLLDPNKNKFPLADEALMRVREAWFVLSDTANRDRYDREIRGGGGGAPPSPPPPPAPFWTLCPYCWYLHEYERKYEGCTFRCGNCMKTFHGAAVKPPEPGSVVEGKEQYYCYHLSLPLRYPVDERCRLEEQGNNNGGRKRMRIKTVANRVRMKGFVKPNDSDSDLEC